MNVVLLKIKKILRSSLFVLFVLHLAIFALLLMIGDDEEFPEAKAGMLDIADWMETHDHLIRLNGEWEFYWNEHLSYHDFQRNALQPNLYAMVPEKWNNYTIDGSTLKSAGYGTYRLQVKVNRTDKTLSLKVMPLSTAYRIYINDQLLAYNGQASKNPDEFQAYGSPKTVEFIPPSETFQIIVHVSNYDYAKGGMNRPLILGTPNEMAALNQNLVYKDGFLIGSLAIACFYS